MVTLHFLTWATEWDAFWVHTGSSESLASSGIFVVLACRALTRGSPSVNTILREGPPAPTRSLLWQAQRPLNLAILLSSSQQMEPLWSSGSAGGQVLRMLTCSTEPVVAAAWATAAVGELARPQGECLKLLKNDLKEEEKRPFLYRRPLQLRNSDCTFSDLMYKWRWPEDPLKSFVSQSQESSQGACVLGVTQKESVYRARQWDWGLQR